jgi:hypothetical protein
MKTLIIFLFCSVSFAVAAALMLKPPCRCRVAGKVIAIPGMLVVSSLLMATSWLQKRIPPTNCHSIFKEQTFVSKPLEEKHYRIVGRTTSGHGSTAKLNRWTTLRTFVSYVMPFLGS